MSPTKEAESAPAPLKQRRFSRVREQVLTAAAGILARTVRPLWYAETIVLSARYQQFLASASWARERTRYRDRIEVWEQAAEPRLRKGEFTVLEFGVADGLATRWWAARKVAFAAWHGFDTFEGLPVDWVRGEVAVMSAGAFTPTDGAGAVPQVEATYPFTWHRGLIEDTLPKLDRPTTSLFVFIDVDLLEPTSAILAWLRAKGRPGDLIYFDEAFDPWNEGLALRQAVAGGLALRAIAYTGSALLVELL